MPDSPSSRQPLFWLIAFAFSFLACGGPSPNKIKVKGSDTLLPIGQNQAQAYMEKNPDASIIVVGGGSGVGIAALRSGTTDLAMSSRAIKLEEKLILKAKGVQLREAVVCKDALAVIVNERNPISQLTREQIESIFIGDVSRWSQLGLGGSDKKITVYSRESSSGTYEFFKDHVLAKKNFANDVLNMAATGAIIEAVKGNDAAIAYVGLAYLSNASGIKAVSVSYDGGKTFVPPTEEGAKSGVYPVTRPLYFYYDQKNYSKVKPFLDFMLSTEGQAIVKQVGYVTIN